jgi:quinoprotein glucose dehydrogenase
MTSCTPTPSRKTFCKDLFRPAAALAALFLTIWIPSTLAQDQNRTTWDGIYSDAQATRGATQYRANCQSCHGATLDGLGPVPPLAGSDFTSNWNGQSVGDLLDKIQTSMPADRPGQLSLQINAEILAYILQYNKFPSGSSELPADAASLKNVRFEAERSKK